MKNLCLLLLALMISVSQNVNAEITEAVDLAVGEGYLVRRNNAPDFPVICLPSSSPESESLLRARNEINKFTVLYDGNSKQVQHVLIRCGAQSIKDTVLYVEYGCYRPMPAYQRDVFTRHVMPISPDEISNGQMTSSFEAKLSEICAANGRKLYFSEFAGVPKRINIQGQKKKPKSVISFE
ncbi:MAG: hypothetical protein JNJ49_07640 [Bdellovibrionaceae bacterium]|nr:hypothetical protein [Pseudobdellovibrionaceae bacterium]